MAKAQSNQAIYDARTLGRPKMLLLGFQHMFAMFGATVLVPALTGLSVSATLLFAGIGTLIFHLLTKKKVPAFLGSSFAFIGGYAAVVAMGAAQGLDQTASLPYACIGVLFAGLMYFVLAGLIKVFGVKKVMRFFPPVVTGPIVHIPVHFLWQSSSEYQEAYPSSFPVSDIHNSLTSALDVVHVLLRLGRFSPNHLLCNPLPNF